ncbi:MAG: sugar phosphate isomerase/epimerase [Clostridia bacterium]|nr:sugar phosphate isomerase/epimerase [Clostridia bacterium]
MKLGAQLFSLRKFIKTPEDIRTTFEKVKAMGFDNVQFSGGGPIEAHELKAISEDTGLPIVCTHSAPDRILNDTEALIEEHKIFGCPVIGIGSMPKEFRENGDGVVRFIEEMKAPVEKILNSGLRFAYHNHDFEFKIKTAEGEMIYDYMLRACPDWQFIMDTYWVEFAGHSAIDYIAKIGADRLTNIHYKDMANTEAREICACGTGTLDFAAITEACLKNGGVENVLIEQDNAVSFDDPFGQMEIGYKNLRPLIK